VPGAQGSGDDLKDRKNSESRKRVRTSGELSGAIASSFSPTGARWRKGHNGSIPGFRAFLQKPGHPADALMPDMPGDVYNSLVLIYTARKIVL